MESVTWLRPEFQGREDELVNLATAARLVGVTRAAVSNWAARHADFPALVLLTGLPPKQVKYVARDEFLAFARTQLDKPRGSRGPSGPRRPHAAIQAERVEHLERQMERLAALEAKHAAALDRTRAALKKTEANLQAARLGKG